MSSNIFVSKIPSPLNISYNTQKQFKLSPSIKISTKNIKNLFTIQCEITSLCYNTFFIDKEINEKTN